VGVQLVQGLVPGHDVLSLWGLALCCSAAHSEQDMSWPQHSGDLILPWSLGH
jgi:hypothetical protein